MSRKAEKCPKCGEPFDPAKDEVVECPKCGTAIEYFKDDRRRTCPGCGATVLNPRFDNGCAVWYAAAENCSIMRGVLAEEQPG